MCIFMSTETSFSTIQFASPDAITVESSLNSFMTLSDVRTMETPRLSTQSALPDATTVQFSSNLMTSSDGTTMETHRSGNSILQRCDSFIIL